MLKDTLFTEESTEEDLTLARAMLAERSAEDIAAALARLYRARLPAPEEVQDPGTFRGREDRSAPRNDRESRGQDRTAPRESRPKSKPRESMGEGSMWFRAAIGRQKNAEARWLLPMICRRGGIEKNDIGAIKIYDANSEFEIAAGAVEKFLVMVKRPDKEDNIRIEPLPNGPEGAIASSRPNPEDRDYSSKRKPSFKDKESYKDKSWNDKPQGDRKPYAGDKPRYEGKPKFEGNKPAYEGKSNYDKPQGDGARVDRPAFKKPRAEKPPYIAKAKREGAEGFAKPAFGKKSKG
jgi:ATP-dependent RNA helicase DeaD